MQCFALPQQSVPVRGPRTPMELMWVPKGSNMGFETVNSGLQANQGSSYPTWEIGMAYEFPAWQHATGRWTNTNRK
eukprot:4526638-Amphidinium_carterae.1